MPSSTSSSEVVRGGALPKGLLAALVLFFASEHFLWNSPAWLAFCRRYVPPYVASDPLRSSVETRLLPKDGPPPIVLVGSSQIHEGMECEEFEQRFPARPCVNLGIAGGTPLDVLFLTDRIDARGIPKRTIVTGVFPQVMRRAPKAAFTDLRTIRCLYRSGVLFAMTPKEWIDDALFGEIQNLAETLRMKDSLFDMWSVVGEDLQGALRGEMPPQPPRALDLVPAPGRAFFRKHIGDVDPAIAPGRFTPVHELALEEVIAREEDRGNHMVVIDFPTRRGYLTTITPEAISAHKRLVERLAARGGVVLVRADDLPALEDSDFHDFTHLAESGRHKVSARIADLLVKIGG